MQSLPWQALHGVNPAVFMKLEICDIHRSYGKNTVLQGVSLSVESGSCVGIVGRNGCGKSTLLSVVAGVSKPDSGTVLVDGNSVFGKGGKVAELIGYVPQGLPLFEELNGYDNLLLWYDKNSLKRSLDSGVLAELGISELLKLQVRKMSGGMKKRLSIACSVAKDPPILLLDEPTSALDIPCRSIICNYLARCKNDGKIILLATHTEEEFSLCDELHVLKDGKLNSFNYNGSREDLALSL